jgi:hypothetical protein
MADQVTLMTPELQSRWCRKDGANPSGDQHHGYTVVAVTNTAHPHERHPPQVIYQGDNGHYWSLPLTEWPGNLVPE